MKSRWIPLFTLLLGIHILLGTWAGAQPASAEPEAIDLGNFDERVGMMGLGQGWAFYWQKLLQPSDPLPEADLQVDLPHLWSTEQLANGEKMSAKGFATYRKVLRNLQPRAGGYQLGMKGAFSAFKLFVYPVSAADQFMVAESGVVDPTQSKGARKVAVIHLNPETASDYVVLLQVGNSEYAMAGAYYPVEIATGHHYTWFLEMEGLINTAGLGAMVAIGIYSFMMWFRRRSDKPALALAVVSFAAFFRVLSTCPFLLNYFDSGWYALLYRIEYATMPMGVGSYMAFLIASFKTGQRFMLGRVLIGVNAALFLMTCITPVMFFSSVLPLYQIVVLICGCVYIWLVAQALLNKVLGSRLVLAGVLLICTAFVYDIMSANNQGGVIYVTPLAVVFFLILQSQMIALRAALTHQKSEELAVELQHKNEEITFFNRNLEKMVAVKTYEIRSLLDHIPQGVVSIETGGVLAKDYSAHLVDILGTEMIAGQKFEKVLLNQTTLTADAKDQIIQSIASVIGENELNFELNIDKFPTEVCYRSQNEEKYLKVTWNVQVDEQKTVQRLLLTLLDVSQEKIFEQKAQEQARLLEMVKELIDVSAERTAQFFSTGLPLLQENQRLIDNADLNHANLRLLFVNAHTVKGAARSLQLKSLAAAVHHAEDGYAAILKGAPIQQKQLSQDCKKAIDVFNSYIYVNREKLNRTEDLSKLTIEREFLENQYFVLKDLVETPNPTIHNLMRTIRDHSDALTTMIFEQLNVVLESYVERAAKIARDVGKPEPEMSFDVIPVPINPEAKVLIEKCMVHILRNALDHGLESAEERRSKLKPVQGKIHIKAERVDRHLRFTIEDDGRGLAIDKLREKGLAAGLLHSGSSLEAVAELIFHTGMTTATGVSNISGRGIGMEAVRRFLDEAGGSIQVRLGHEAGEPGYYHFQLQILFPYRPIRRSESAA
jgi:signal transduction histidine kinase